MKKIWADMNDLQRSVTAVCIVILAALLVAAYPSQANDGGTATASNGGTTARDNMKYDPLTTEALAADAWSEDLEQIYLNRHGWQTFNDAPEGTWHNEINTFTAGIHGELEVLIHAYDSDSGRYDALAHQVATNLMMDLHDYDDAPTSVSVVGVDRKIIVTVTPGDVGL